MSCNQFSQIDVRRIPVVPEVSLEELFGVSFVEAEADRVHVTMTLTKEALRYLCAFSSDANSAFHDHEGLVQGSIWMWMVQHVVSKWLPLHGPVKFEGTLPEASFVQSGQQAGFTLTIFRAGKRELGCVVRGPFTEGVEEAPTIFQFSCHLFPMKLALRGRPG